MARCKYCEAHVCNRCKMPLPVTVVERIVEVEKVVTVERIVERPVPVTVTTMEEMLLAGWTMQRIEEEAHLAALRLADGKVYEAARMLGTGKTSVYRRMRGRRREQ